MLLPSFARILTVLTLWCGLLALPLGAQTQNADYCNQRFGYCISYPPAILKPQPEAQNGDGRAFVDRQGKKRLLVYGSGEWNFSKDGATAVSLSELYAQELHGGRFPAPEARRVVTYKKLAQHWFVISGTENGGIFYLKVIRREDAFCFAKLSYPADLAPTYNPIAALIAASFK